MAARHQNAQESADIQSHENEPGRLYLFRSKVVRKERPRFIPSRSTLTPFRRSPEGVHERHAYAHVTGPWPEALWSAVKQTALTSGRGGDGGLRLIVRLLGSGTRSSLLRKSFQGDVLFSLVLQTTLLFKQHRGEGKKKRGKTHFFHFEHVTVCEGGLEAGVGEWGGSRISTNHFCLRLGGEARKKEQVKTRGWTLSGS